MPLTLRIPGERLVQHFKERAEYHKTKAQTYQQKAQTYQQQMEAIGNVANPGATYDPKQALLATAKDHRQKQTYFELLAEFTDATVQHEVTLYDITVLELVVA